MMETPIRSFAFVPPGMDYLHVGCSEETISVIRDRIISLLLTEIDVLSTSRFGIDEVELHIISDIPPRDEISYDAPGNIIRNLLCNIPEICNPRNVDGSSEDRVCTRETRNTNETGSLWMFADILLR